jgi:Fe2+ transport system protein FeoA
VEGSNVTLADVSPGERARILAVASVNGDRRRLIELGVRRGAVVEVLRRAPLRGALAIKVGTGSLALRMDSARDVLVQQVDEDA